MAGLFETERTAETEKSSLLSWFSPVPVRFRPSSWASKSAIHSHRNRKVLLEWLLIAVGVVVFAASSVHGEAAADPQPGKPAGQAAKDPMARFRFAPMWRPVPRFPQVSKEEGALPIPFATYAIIWQPRWQDELGLSTEQKDSLLTIHAEAMARSKAHSEEFKKLSPEERQAEVKARAGKTSLWRQQFVEETRTRIEAVLTPQQLQEMKDFYFPRYAVGLLYDAEIRGELGFAPQQEGQFRRVARERLARIQAVSIDKAEKQWDMLTREQQAAIPEVVRRQGPTSAILSIAWELGFDMDNAVPGYPILAEAPVRERVGLSDEQEKQLNAVVAACAERRRTARQEQQSGKASHPDALGLWEDDAKRQVEAILTSEQLAKFNEIEFRRKVALALSYPEKRKKVGITEQQLAAFEQLEQEAHAQNYRIDCEMLDRALESLTPEQEEQLRVIIDGRFY